MSQLSKGFVAEPKARRDRNMDAKRARISDAAARLLAERGYAGVTTQAVSDAADVAVGTLFRYAATKADLLLMVYNVEFGAAIAAGRTAACQHDDPAEAVFALVLPVLERNSEQPENAIHYQRELLFGQGAMMHRDEGLGLVDALEDSIAAILLGVADRDDEAARAEAQRASRLVFAGLHLALAQPSTHAHRHLPVASELHAQVELVVRGFLGAVRPTDVPARSAGTNPRR